MNNDRNRIRAFADVVSVDAWHEPFSSEKQEVDLKVDVVFSEGRIGGEKDSNVQFRLRLRRATLMVVTPEIEPVGVVRESIKRTQDTRQIEWSTEKVKESQLTASLGGKAALSTGSAAAAFEASVNGKNNVTCVSTEKEIGRSQSMTAIFRFDNIENTYNWEIACEASQFLEGRAWDANASPLMKLRDLRRDRNRGIAPGILVIIRCLREDLIISDIKIKDELSMKDKLLGNEGKIKLKAAEAYIRSKLCDVGLDVGELDNEFSRIVLLEMSAKADQ